MDVNERIKGQLDSSPVLLYMKGTPDFPQCGFSNTAVQILKSITTEFETFDVLADNDIREGIKPEVGIG